MKQEIDFETPTEYVLDRSYDQTAQHVHEQGRKCLECVDQPSVEPPFNGHVSPVVLEMKVIDLTRQLEAAHLRIRQFEILADRLACEVDRCKVALETVDVRFADRLACEVDRCKVALETVDVRLTALKRAS